MGTVNIAEVFKRFSWALAIRTAVGDRIFNSVSITRTAWEDTSYPFLHVYLDMRNTKCDTTLTWIEENEMSHMG